MTVYLKDRDIAVQYVDDLLTSLKPGCALTMTIVPGQFADFSAITVITGLLEDIEKTPSKPSTIILPLSIPDGSSLPSLPERKDGSVD